MSKLADDLERLCCAETEGKFFDCVTDSITEIIAALREAERLRHNLNDVVETKRRTDERLKLTIKALQAVLDASNDPYEIAQRALRELSFPVPQAGLLWEDRMSEAQARFYDAELANVTGRLFDAQNKIARLRTALEETLVTMKHATVFLHTRERIHQDGFALWMDNIQAIETALGLSPSPSDGAIYAAVSMRGIRNAEIEEIDAIVREATKKAAEEAGAIPPSNRADVENTDASQSFRNTGK